MWSSCAFAFVENAARARRTSRGEICHGRSRNLLEPKSSQEMQSPVCRRHRTVCEWKALRLFPFLRDHDRPHASERRDLPVDVQHLRFKKGRAIRRDHRDVRRPGSSVQKLNSKNLMPFHFPDPSGFDGDALLGGAVTRGRKRIKHLQRITATNRPRNHSAGSARRRGGGFWAGGAFRGTIGAVKVSANAELAINVSTTTANIFFIILPPLVKHRTVLPGFMLRLNYISMDYLEKAGRVLEIEIFELQRLRSGSAKVSPTQSN